MNETAAKEYWAVHADGTPVRTIADIIRRRAEATPDGVAIQEPGRLTTFRGSRRSFESGGVGALRARDRRGRPSCLYRGQRSFLS